MLEVARCAETHARRADAVQASVKSGAVRGHVARAARRQPRRARPARIDIARPTIPALTLLRQRALRSIAQLANDEATRRPLGGGNIAFAGKAGKLGGTSLNQS